MSLAKAKDENVKNTRTSEGETAEPNASQKEQTFEKDDRFYCDPLVILRVEDCLFRIPQELLEAHSEVFRTMFTLPSGLEGEESSEGRVETKPLYLEGVKKGDFGRFLAVLSALNYEGISTGNTRGKTNLLVSRFPLYHDLSTEDWVAVLRLANMWNFDNVRTKAMQILQSDTSFEIMDRLKLAYDLDITSSSWLLPVYRHLVRRETPLAQKEVPYLSDDFLKKVTRLREERLKSLLVSLLGGDAPRPTCDKCRKSLTKPVLKDLVGVPHWEMLCSSCNISINLEDIIQKNLALEKARETFDSDLDRLIDFYLPTSKD